MNNKGFTLIESLVVLSILAIVTSFTFIVSQPDRLQINYFFSQLKADLFVTQQYAISHGQEITFSIDPNNHLYYVRDRMSSRYIIKRNYSEKIMIETGTLPMSFKYLTNGNASLSGTLLFRIEGELYKFTILLGRGRFKIEKL